MVEISHKVVFLAEVDVVALEKEVEVTSQVEGHNASSVVAMVTLP